MRQQFRGCLPVIVTFLFVLFYGSAVRADGDENTNPHGVKWSLSASQGALFIFEGAYHPPGLFSSLLPGTYKIGSWYHTGELEDLMDTDGTGEPRRYHRNYGAYFIADQMIYKENEAQGLGVFVQIGGAPCDRNEVDFYIGGGLNYLGLIPGRDADYCGVSVAHAAISHTLRKAEDRDAAETVLELTYKVQLTPFLSLQPDVQYVINPGADPALENAVVAMVRVETIF